MVEVIALLMIVNNEIKEHRIQPDMATCLRGKKKLKEFIKKTYNILVLNLWQN